MSLNKPNLGSAGEDRGVLFNGSWLTPDFFQAPWSRSVLAIWDLGWSLPSVLKVSWGGCGAGLGRGCASS